MEEPEVQRAVPLAAAPSSDAVAPVAADAAAAAGAADASSAAAAGGGGSALQQDVTELPLCAREAEQTGSGAAQSRPASAPLHGPRGAKRPARGAVTVGSATLVLAEGDAAAARTAVSPKALSGSRPGSRRGTAEPAAEKAAAGVLMQLSDVESGRPPPGSGAVARPRRRPRAKTVSPTRQLPPIRDAPETGKMKEMRSIGRAPPLLKRGVIAQMARIERERPTPTEQWWEARAGRVSDPRSGVYTMPKPREVPNVESCIVRQLPCSLAGGLVPRSFLNLVNFAKAGIVSNGILGTSDVADTVASNPGVFGRESKHESSEQTQSVDAAPSEIPSVTELVETGRRSPPLGQHQRRRCENGQASPVPAKHFAQRSQGYFMSSSVSVGQKSVGLQPGVASKYKTPLFTGPAPRLAAVRKPVFELPDPLEISPLTDLRY
eukprot:TRINITY_DN14587_c0_g1_i4.p1 TRINITY_DN14587_c0_g1~~TRINITY_DN14587_c0_g1_i4.p1  ORF type:complete len:453 (+),score=94.75 TRINITY_DN14587_c0_g1_i4:55-1359(+)